MLATDQRSAVIGVRLEPHHCEVSIGFGELEPDAGLRARFDHWVLTVYHRAPQPK
ncbi:MULTISPECIES: hypothetical protein [unclassified Rhodococcus (in: high G+C Gram-positive bacteria)]|uniref:hypothetical protein n=1 Tax=unclassified Rhodococcus (in: high G+C Gram-positive bacteria) TaxID=192944 RepID=UPI0002D5574E|nr:hypothetical protein [Rhodococcus sp. DK17]